MDFNSVAKGLTQGSLGHISNSIEGAAFPNIKKFFEHADVHQYLITHYIKITWHNVHRMKNVSTNEETYLIFVFENVVLSGISFGTHSPPAMFFRLSRTFSLLENTNISKLNFSPSIFSKCHNSLYYSVHVLYIKLSLCKDRDRRREEHFRRWYDFLHFCGTKDFWQVDCPFIAFSYLPPPPLSLLFAEPCSRRREMVDISEDVPDFPPLFLQ